eukprot:87147_1
MTLCLISIVSILISTVKSKCSCDSSDEFIHIDKNLCFTKVIDGTFPLPVSWAFPNLNITDDMKDINGESYFVYQEGNDENEGGYISNPNLEMGGILILSDGLQILFDAGIGEVNPAFVPSDQSATNNLYAHLQRLGCTDIDIVISSHLHFDHTGWNVKYDKSEEKTEENQFPIIPSWGHPTIYFVQNDEYYYWKEFQLDDPLMADLAYSATKHMMVTHVESLVKSGQIALRFGDYPLTSNVYVERCIGHTPGHQCLYLYDDNKELRAMFSGDALHSPFQVTMPDLCAAFDVNQTESTITRHKLVNKAFEGNDILFVPLHFPGIGNVIKCDNCNSQNGLIWRKLNVEDVKKWSANVMGDNKYKQDLR